MKIKDIISQIVEGNAIFTNSHNHEYFDSFKSEQQPYITLVTCSDSRVPLNALMQDTSNKVFSIQNIGNQVLSTEGSVDYGIYILKTPLLMIMGHSDCGAIKAYLNGFEKETYNIKHELDFLKPIISEHVNKLDNKNLLAHTIENNLDYQVSIAYKKYKDLVHSGELTIIGGFYDFNEEFGKGSGRIIIVNVNKQKSVSQLYNLSEFENLTTKQKEIHLGRLPG
jgi:carbonic anhydrase